MGAEINVCGQVTMLNWQSLLDLWMLYVGFLVCEPDCILRLTPVPHGLPATAQGTRGHTAQPCLGSQFPALLTLGFRRPSPVLTLPLMAAPGASSKFYLLLLTALSCHCASRCFPTPAIDSHWRPYPQQAMTPPGRHRIFQESLLRGSIRKSHQRTLPHSQATQNHPHLPFRFPRQKAPARHSLWPCHVCSPGELGYGPVWPVFVVQAVRGKSADRTLPEGTDSDSRPGSSGYHHTHHEPVSDNTANATGTNQI